MSRYNFAAIDIVMCGACNPYHSLPVLKDVFAPKTITPARADPVTELLGREQVKRDQR